MTHKFGNIDSWTKNKLDKVERYLDAYLIALKKQRFRLEYIDAFAGSGFVARKKIAMAGETLFDEDESVSLKDFIDGSARIALQTSPAFDRYVFIEKHRKRFEELQQLKIEFPNLASSIETIRGDANDEVQKLCSSNWLGQHRRGVMFLDPYGTQVSWATIAAIANTRAIDLFILFPIGTVNRLLNRDGRIIPARKERLDRMFGDDRWFEKLYTPVQTGSLFSSDLVTTFSKAGDPFSIITKYFVERLKTVFAEVAETPLIMRNSTNSPIFLLGFASGNPIGGPIAVKIAQHILKQN